MITSSLSSEKTAFTAAIGQWISLSDGEQRKILTLLVEKTRKVTSDSGLSMPEAGFLEFAVRTGLHNFQMYVAAGNEKDTPQNRDRFCTDFVLKLVSHP
jgi:hypothetical protein